MPFEIKNPFPLFTDKDGASLENGMLFIGTKNLNPESNPLKVFFDKALTIPAAQPVRTLAGYPSRNGNPSDIFIAETSYSLTVRDKNSVFVFSDDNVQVIDDGVIVVSAGSNINITGNDQEPIINVDLNPTFDDVNADNFIATTLVSAPNVTATQVSAANVNSTNVTATNTVQGNNVTATNIVAANTVNATTVNATTVNATTVAATNVTASSSVSAPNVTATTGNIKGSTIANAISANTNLTHADVANELIIGTSASARTLTISNDNGTWITGDMVIITQQEAGQLTIAVEGGLGWVLDVPSGLNPKTRTKSSSIAIIVVSQSRFILAGDLEITP